MGLFDWIRKGVSLIAPHAGKLIGWGAEKLGGFAMKRMQDAAANENSVFGRAVRNYGPQVAEWIGTKPFEDTMRKFGETVDNTTVGKLIRFPDGMTAGTAMVEANNRMMNFLKNGGVAPTNNITVDRQIENGQLENMGKDEQMKDQTQGVQPERDQQNGVMDTSSTGGGGTMN